MDKGSAWVPAFAGTHASDRAGKELELFHPTQNKKLKFKGMSRV